MAQYVPKAQEARNKAVVERYFREVLDQKKIEVMPELLARDVVPQSAPFCGHLILSPFTHSFVEGATHEYGLRYSNIYVTIPPPDRGPRRRVSRSIRPRALTQAVR